MDSDEYVYLIHADLSLEDLSFMDFVGKLGKGIGRRYKDYITPYGKRYLVTLMKIDNPLKIEGEILSWCREKGYIRGRTETLYLEVIRSDTIEDCIERYSSMISDIISCMKNYSNLVITFPLVEVDMSLLDYQPQRIWCPNNTTTDDYMDNKYKGWKDRNEDAYKDMVRNNDLLALEFAYNSMIPKLPKEYIACAACEAGNEDIFQWAISDITNYKMVITSAARHNRLEFLQQMENDIPKVNDMLEIITNIARHNNYNQILEWISPR